MVNTPATEHAAALAKQHWALGVGLHFNITLGRPVSDAGSVKSLVDEYGFFYPRSVLARRLLLRLVSAEHIERELNAQFERMQALGLRATHIDSHQHLHAFPLCFDAVAGLCAAQRIPVRMPWILNPAGVHSTVRKQLKQVVLRAMLARNGRRWSARLHWNSGLGSIFDLGAVPETLATNHYRQLLEAAQGDAFELMVHPARDALELVGLTRIGDFSEREWRFLMSGELLTVINELGFTPGNYSDIPM
tara:strand:+ start:663 stop:1406 length:744 start_codon:yes stop_codon:yes gene_type:complete